MRNFLSNERIETFESHLSVVFWDSLVRAVVGLHSI